jgi:hypothetical protein
MSLLLRRWVILLSMGLLVAPETMGFSPQGQAVSSRGSLVATALSAQPVSTSGSSSTLKALGSPVCEYHEVSIPTSQAGPPRQTISVEDLTPVIKDMLVASGMKQGVANVISRHTTTAITINERESRLAKDMAKYFLELVPPDERSSSEAAQAGVRYFHNDIDQRPESEEEAQRCRDNGWVLMIRNDSKRGELKNRSTRTVTSFPCWWAHPNRSQSSTAKWSLDSGNRSCW